MILLVDANNFYVACERIFRPDLQHKPVLVLSNPNGCVIARSSCVKGLGVPMGVPFKQVQKLCRDHHVTCFNANHTLYQNISSRMMKLLSAFDPQLDVYSIDEAFIHSDTPEITSQAIQTKIHQCLGIKVSVGSGPTKTLAKLANHIAKKHTVNGLFHDVNQDWLKKTDIQDVWGIGSRYTQKLKKNGLFTAFDLQSSCSTMIKQLLGTTGLRVYHELRGMPCYGRTQTRTLSITRSATFAQHTDDRGEIEAALLYHLRRATQALHQAKKVCRTIELIWTEQPYCHKRITINLPHATDQIHTLLTQAKGALQQAPPATYRKIGIILHHLSDKSEQLPIDPMQTMIAQVQQKFGQNSLCWATEAYGHRWQKSTHQRSPNYLSCWQSLYAVS
jgi:DNA polymerase V